MRKILSLLLVSTVLALNAGASTTFTTNYSLAKPSDGSTTWGADIRNDLDSIDSQMFINAGSIANHIADTTGAHAATAISATPGSFCSSQVNVQDYLDCLDGQIAAIVGGGVVTLAGTQTITGLKTFSALLTASAGLTTTGTNTFSSLGLGIAHLSSGGVMSSSTIVDADVNASAAIARSKLASGSNNHVIINDGSGVMSSEAQLAISRGGSGQSTANAALNAFLPSQATNSGKVLGTDGTNTSWVTSGSGTVTSVDMSVPAFLSVSGNPITSSGTLAVTLSGTALPIANGGTGQTSANAAFNALAPSQATNSGKVLTTDGTNTSWTTASAGTVTSVSVTSANGFAGSVATSTSTPAITISTSITGLLKGNGTAISAAGISDLPALTGYTIGTTIGTVSATDSILQAIQKLAGNQRIAEFDSGNSGTSKTIDFSTAPSQKSTLTGNVTYTFSNPIAGQAYILKTVGDGTVRTVTWPASVKWAGGTAPTMTGTSGKIDIINFYYDGTNYYGSYSQNY